MNGKPRALRRLPLKLNQGRLAKRYLTDAAMQAGGSALGYAGNYGAGLAARTVVPDGGMGRWGVYVVPPAMALIATVGNQMTGQNALGGSFVGAALYPFFQAIYGRVTSYQQAFRTAPRGTEGTGLTTEHVLAGGERAAALHSILDPYNVGGL